VAEGTGLTILRPPLQAPEANALCKRFLRGVRAECPYHVVILDDDHLASILRRYCAYFNDARPHQGIGQKIPTRPPDPLAVGGPIEETPILGGLHHDCRRAA
jgi:putative transposase